MAPRNLKPQSTQVATLIPSKVDKRKARKARAATTTTKRSGRLTRSTRPPPPSNQLTVHRVKRYRNGLLNLETIPHHLEAIVKRNATDLPLLRLPPEIRNMIWHFALGGQLVKLPDRHGKGGAVRYTHDRHVDVRRIWQIEAQRQSQRVPFAFHLPEVSRQIYSESALMAYARCTFTLGWGCSYSLNGITRLKAVQKRTIASIEPDPWVTISCFHGYKCMKPFRNTYFPNLRTIVISRIAFELVRTKMHFELSRDGRCAPASQDGWKMWITEALRQKEGADLEVEFKDPDPSW